MQELTLQGQIEARVVSQMRGLSVDLQQQVLDFVEFLAAREGMTQPAELAQKRTIVPGTLMGLKGLLRDAPDLSDEVREAEYVDYLLQKYQ